MSAAEPAPDLTVVLPTHNPDPNRLRETLAGLRAQTLESGRWSLLVVNNASTAFPGQQFFAEHGPRVWRVVEEPNLGLTHARQRGFREVQSAIAVLVDDDNVLAPDYLARVLEIFSGHSRLGAIGGKSVPRFESSPPEALSEFLPLLALRDLGDSPIISQGLRPAGSTHNQYPEFAPVGAGMALRQEAWIAWLQATERRTSGLTDRRGDDLSSAGDNDIILCAMEAGWEVGYFPDLTLTHLIPSGRLAPDYLARLNYGIQKSWQQVLALHDASPWRTLSPFGARLRATRAWFRHRPWTSAAARIRWRGACGHFEGRVSR